MEFFTENWKLAKVIHTNYLLLPVINRFGIRLGFQDKTVKEICTQNNISQDFFLSIVNAFHNSDYFPEKELLKIPIEQIVDYLRKTHLYYQEYVIPDIELRLKKLLANCEGNCKKIQAVQRFYYEYKVELSAHFKGEEENVFPYALGLSAASVNNKKNAEPLPVFINIEEEHSEMDEKLTDLKNIIIKYLEPHYNDNDCNAFLFSIFRFEKDLADHSRIEDTILSAKIKQLEKELS